MGETKRPLVISAEGYILVDTAELKRLKNIEDRGVYKLRQLKEASENRFSERRKAHIKAIAFVLGIGEINTVTATQRSELKMTSETGDQGNNNDERCPDCGQTPNEGACYFCKMD